MATKQSRPAFHEAFLAGACARNAPIEVMVPGRESTVVLKSRLLAGPAEAAGCVIIETPTAGGRPVAFQPRQVIDVILNIDGQRYGFRTSVEKRTRARLGGRTEVNAIAVVMPSAIIPVQRRRYYRVHVPSLDPVPVECAVKVRGTEGAGKETLVRFEAGAMDISAGGMCLRFPKKQGCFAVSGVRLGLFFRIGSSRKLSLLGEVRHTRPLPNGETAVGMLFIEADGTVSRRKAIDAVTRYIARRQREELKKQSGLE